MRYTTAFSGVDAPGAALHVSLVQLRARMASMPRTDLPIGEMQEPQHLAAIEWLQASQRELLNPSEVSVR